MPASLCVEEIDLSLLVESLRARVGTLLEASYLRGRTIVRDAVEEELGCSDEVAEQLVETLELQGFIRFPLNADDTHPPDRQVWRIG